MFDIPNAYKPIFLNMNINLEGLNIEDMIDNASSKVAAINSLFGLNWNSPILTHGKICFEEDNHWIWMPASNGNSLSSNIYTFLNSNHSDFLDWIGLV